MKFISDLIEKIVWGGIIFTLLYFGKMLLEGIFTL